MTSPIGPLPLAPIHLPKVWGGRALEPFGRCLPEGPVGESIEASTLDSCPSFVSTGPFAGRDLRTLSLVMGPDLLGRHAELPFVIKVLDVRDPLSIQLHPGPERSEAMGLPRTKSEGWVVLQTGPRARVGLGLLPSVWRAELIDRCQQGTAEEALQTYWPHRGEIFFIPGGTLHYADGGVLLYEFQRPVDVTMRLYDWGRAQRGGSRGTLQEALDAAFEKRVSGLPGRGPAVLFSPSRRDGTFEAEGFRVRFVAIDEGGPPRDMATVGEVLAITVIDGSLAIEAPSHGLIQLNAIETAILPAGLGRFTLARPADAAGQSAAILCEVRD